MGANRDEGAGVRCVAIAPAIADAVAAAGARALAAATAGLFSELVICGDDLPGADEGWLSLEQGDGGPPRLVIFCTGRSFADPRRLAATPPPEVWERQGPPAAAPDDDTAGSFAADEAAAFLHHQVALAADLVQGALQPDLVPMGLAAAFTAAWDVVIDGRLARAGLPGYGQARRRGRFSRLFATGGVLMPGHWQIFQALWDGALPTQAEVLGVVRRLPRLG